MKSVITKILFSGWTLLIINAMVAGQDTIMKKLSDTGQSKKYSKIFGEDADYSINVPSFTVNADGTVKDNITNLTWQRSDGGEMTWEVAQDYCSKLNLGGYTWRLPTSHELFGILNHSGNPAIDNHAFTLTDAEYWWTGQASLEDKTKIWSVNSGGGIGPHAKSEAVSAGGSRRFHTRCVKDVTWTQAYTDNGNGTITDSKTGLMWQKIPLSTTKTWFEALSYAENLVFAGYSDWRLPNVKELQSISEDSFLSPSVNPVYFPSTESSLYWSSTTLFSQDTTKAWITDFRNGLVTYSLKTESHFIRCVRNANFTTGLNKPFTVDKQITISPNPSNDFANIVFSQPIKNEVSIDIFGIDGKLIKNITDKGSSVQSISLGTFKPGIYIVLVTIDKIASMCQKLIVN